MSNDTHCIFFEKSAQIHLTLVLEIRVISTILLTIDFRFTEFIISSKIDDEINRFIKSFLCQILVLNVAHGG